MKRISLIALIIVASFTGQAYNFYLSINKVFGPDEDAFVNLYSYNGGRADITLTLYQVTEPQKFFREHVLKSNQSSIPDNLIRDLEVVKTWKDQISSQRYYNRQIKLGQLTPGAYILEGLSKGEISQVPVIISEYGLVMRNTGNELVAYVTDRKTGKQAKGFTMYGYLADSTVAPVEYQDHVGHFKLDNANQYAYYVPIVAAKGDRIAVSQTYFYNYYNQGNQNLKGYIFTDRSAYRPEQWVYFKGIFRDRDGFEYSVAKDSVVYTVYGPENNEIAKKKVKLDKNGSFNDSVYVEESWKLGEYTIKYGRNQTYYWYYNNQNNDCSFRVEEYKKPEFEVNVHLDKPQYVTGDKIEADINAKYFFGAPVTNATVNYSIVRSPHYIPYWYWYPWSWWYSDYYNDYYGHHNRQIVHTGNGKIEEDGSFKVEYQTKDENPGNYKYTVVAEVQDASRRTISGSSTAILSHTEFMLSASSGKYYYSTDEDITVNVRSFDFSRNPVGTKFKVYVHRYDTYKNQYGYQSTNWNHKEAVDTIYGTTDDQMGVGKVRFKMDASGYYYFVVSALDSREKEVTAGCYSYVINPDDQRYYWWQQNSGSVQILTDNKVYKRGDKVKAMVYLPHSADALMTVQGKGFAHYGVYEFSTKGDNGATQEIEIDIDKHTYGKLQIHVAYMHDNQMYQYHDQITVIPDDEYLDVAMEFDKESYEPGEWAEVTVTVKDNVGRPVPYADVTVATVDESIFFLYPDESQDIRKAFYSGKQQQNNYGYYNNYFNQYSYSRQIPVDGISWRRKKLDVKFDRDVFVPAGEWYRSYYEESNEEFPKIHGFIIEHESGDPIPNARVRMGGKSFKADDDGYYSLEGFKVSHVTLDFIGLGHQSTIENIPLYSNRDLGLNVTVSKRRDHTIEMVEDPVITDITDGRELSEAEATTELASVTGGVSRNSAKSAAFTLTDSMDMVATDEEASGEGLAPMEKNRDKSAEMQEQLQGKKDKLVEAKVRSDFKDAIYWNPSVRTNAYGEAVVRFKMPDNLTTWRVTAKAITKDTKVGQTFGKVITKKDLLVRMETPRFITVGDEMFIATNVHNYLDTDKDVTVQLEADGIAVKGTKTKIKVKANGEKRVDWTIAANWVTESKLTVKALTNEKSDAMEVTVPVLPYGLEMVKAESVYASNDATKTMNIDVPKEIDLNTADLELSTAPSISAALLNSMDDLIGYPYGCVEQTMSRFMPNVVVANTLKNLGADYASTIDKGELQKMVAQGTKRLKELQHNDGGWGWWENDKSKPIMTAYVVYGLHLAKKAGYNVDASLYQKGEQALLRQIQSKSRDNSTTYAYQMMVAMSMGHDDLWEDAKVAGSSSEPYETALWAQAAYYAGDMETAKVKAAHLTDKAIMLGSAAHWGGKKFYYRWQDDKVETTAHCIKALSLIDPDNRLIPKAVQWLMSQRRGNSWYNTRQTAYSILGLQEIIKKEYNPDMDVTLYVNDIMIDKFHVGGDDVYKKGNTYHIKGETFLSAVEGASEKFSLLTHGNNTIKVVQSGSGGSYVNAKLTYFLDGEHEMTQEEKEKQVFEVTRTYFKLEREKQNNGTWIYKKKEIKGEDIKSGDNILVKTHIKAPTAYEYVLIEDPIPAGCEFIRDVTSYRIEGEALYNGDGNYWNSRYWGYWNWNRWYTHHEYRDSKYALTITNMGAGQYDYSYLMKAQIPGEFKINPAVAQLMYYPETRGFSEFGEMVIEE